MIFYVLELVIIQLTKYSSVRLVMFQCVSDVTMKSYFTILLLDAYE